MAEIILHHYPQSPVTEKVRIVMGMKKLAWRSVEIPRLPPKPDLIPLTGGYRRTPVMQIGADVYCDTQCIIRELERRYPQPTLYPGGGAGMPWALSRWTDVLLFRDAITVVFGAQADTLPEEFANDRGRLYFGPDFSLKSLEKSLAHSLAQLRAQFGWIEQRLESGRDFMLGADPGLPDALAYFIVWFVRGRYPAGPEFLGQFPELCAWEQRVAAIGHGQPSEMSSREALDVAKQSTPQTLEAADPADPQGLAPGMQVGVEPDEDSGDTMVYGEIVSVNIDQVAIRRHDEKVGEVVIHFPRVGYRVAARS